MLWDWGSDVRMRVWAGPHPWSFNPFMPRPSAVMLLSNPRWSRSLSQVSISEWREPDREQTVKASRVCFQGKNLSFCCFHSLNTLSTPEAVFSSTYGDLSLKCCCDCRECSQKRNKHFENIWMHVLSFLWCLWWLIFFFFFGHFLVISELFLLVPALFAFRAPAGQNQKLAYISQPSWVTVCSWPVNLPAVCNYWQFFIAQGKKHLTGPKINSR